MGWTAGEWRGAKPPRRSPSKVASSSSTTPPQPAHRLRTGLRTVGPDAAHRQRRKSLRALHRSPRTLLGV